jgi:hypothetical protein
VTLRARGVTLRARWVTLKARWVTFQGFAYMGLRRWRDAKGAFETGLQYDPFNEDLKRGLEESTQGVLKDLIEGRSKEVRVL